MSRFFEVLETVLIAEAPGTAQTDERSIECTADFTHCGVYGGNRCVSAEWTLPKLHILCTWRVHCVAAAEGDELHIRYQLTETYGTIAVVEFVHYKSVYDFSEMITLELKGFDIIICECIH